jgi:hypothetical protein
VLLLTRYFETPFIVYFSVCLCLAAATYLLIKHVERLYKANGSNHPSYTIYSKVHRILYPFLSGLLGAQSVLFAKATAELVHLSIQGENQFASPGTYVILLAMVIFIFNQVCIYPFCNGKTKVRLSPFFVKYERKQRDSDTNMTHRPK